MKKSIRKKKLKLSRTYPGYVIDKDLLKRSIKYGEEYKPRKTLFYKRPFSKKMILVSSYSHIYIFLRKKTSDQIIIPGDFPIFPAYNYRLDKDCCKQLYGKKGILRPKCEHFKYIDSISSDSAYYDAEEIIKKEEEYYELISGRKIKRK